MSITTKKGKELPGILDTRTGKVLMTQSELVKIAKKWLDSKTPEELQAIIDEGLNESK